jgi:hypothetical protein
MAAPGIRDYPAAEREQLYKGYNGNKLITPITYEHAYTQAELDEFVKCADDPIYFLKTYVKIVNVDRGLINFDVYPYQERLINTFYSNRQTIVMTPRQAGKTTVSVGFMLHFILFNPDVHIGIAANKQAMASEIMDRLKKAYEHLPIWLQQGVRKWDMLQIGLGNGSRVTAGATASSAFRGQSFNVLFLDEFAFLEDHVAEEFWTSVYPTISSGGSTKVIIVSTPNGMNLFHRLWTGANNKKNTFVPERVFWSDVPGRDAAWADQMRKDIGPDRFEQEFECEFLSQTGTLISSKKLRDLMNGYIDPALTRPPHTRIWHECIKGELNAPADQKEKGMWKVKPHTYVVTVDTGEGGGNDDSVATVIDVTEMPYQVAAVWQSNQVGTMEFPMFIHELCLEYNRAHLLIEVNDIGLQIADIMRYEFEYDNIITTVTKERSRQVVSGGATKQIRWGVKMDKVNKRIACATLKTLVEKDQLTVVDYETISELNTFVREKQSYEAQEGKKDDLVMGLAIFAWLTQQQYFIDLTDSNVRRQFTGLDKIEQDVTPFGFINDGINPVHEPDKSLEHVPLEDRWLIGN